MIKLFITIAVAGAFAIGSAMAGSCGGCTGEKGKGKKGDKGKETTKESYSYQITL